MNFTVLTASFEAITTEQKHQVLIIASGVTIGVSALYVLWQVVRILNWIGAHLHALVLLLLSAIYCCIAFVVDIFVKIGRLATGFALLALVLAGFWAYTTTGSVFSYPENLLAYQWVQLVQR